MNEQTIPSLPGIDRLPSLTNGIGQLPSITGGNTPNISDSHPFFSGESQLKLWNIHKNQSADNAQNDSGGTLLGLSPLSSFSSISSMGIPPPFFMPGCNNYAQIENYNQGLSRCFNSTSTDKVQNTSSQGTMSHDFHFNKGKSFSQRPEQSDNQRVKQKSKRSRAGRPRIYEDNQSKNQISGKNYESHDTIYDLKKVDDKNIDDHSFSKNQNFGSPPPSINSGLDFGKVFNEEEDNETQTLSENLTNFSAINNMPNNNHTTNGLDVGYDQDITSTSIQRDPEIDCDIFSKVPNSIWHVVPPNEILSPALQSIYDSIAEQEDDFSLQSARDYNLMTKREIFKRIQELRVRVVRLKQEEQKEVLRSMALGLIS